MTSLSIDVETYSDLDIKEVGTYKYTESPAFEILLFSYSIDGSPVITIDLTCEDIPLEVENALFDPEVIKTAYNAAFERRCLSVHYNTYLPPEQWQCTMVKCAMVGLPFGLDNVAKALHLDQGKMKEGKALIRFFCMPCKPTKANGQRKRNRSYDAPEKWAEFKKYNNFDVVLERQIAKKIEFYQVPEMEKQLWALDQKMNDRGVLLDLEFIQAAIKMNDRHTDYLDRRLKKLTSLDNPNSGPQLKRWLAEQIGCDVDSLTKNAVIKLKEKHNGVVHEVLELKQELAKTSNKKYPAMIDCRCADGRARGTIQYYGAGRTGRYSGRLFQPQNLTKPVLPNKDNIADYYELDEHELEIARQAILKGSTEDIKMLFGNVPDTISACLRTALVASPGSRIIAPDLSSIEARVIAWLAGEKWKLDIFRTTGKIYEAAGARMFKVPIETITKGSKLRDKSKIAELALGFGGGVDALLKMHALEMGLEEDELQPLVYAWRGANPAIVNFWYALNAAAMYCVRNKVKVRLTDIDIYSYNTGQYLKKPPECGIVFNIERGILFITLPSGRRLAYLRPQITKNIFGGDCVSYEGIHQKTKQWCRIDTYGGKLAENIVQGTARDVLAEKMLMLDKAGYNLILSVHDEIPIDQPEGVGTLEECLQIMRTPCKWAPGLPLNAEGFESKYYKK